MAKVLGYKSVIVRKNGNIIVQTDSKTYKYVNSLYKKKCKHTLYTFEA